MSVRASWEECADRKSQTRARARGLPTARSRGKVLGYPKTLAGRAREVIRTGCTRVFRWKVEASVRMVVRGLACVWCTPRVAE
eukprot:57683-Pyramimonas_sp.AAC.1